VPTNSPAPDLHLGKGVSSDCCGAVAYPAWSPSNQTNYSGARAAETPDDQS